MRLPWIAIVVCLAVAAPARGAEPAADGTQSVVVPAEPPAAPGQTSVLVPPAGSPDASPAQPPATVTETPAQPPAAPPLAGLAGELLGQALEPLASRPGAVGVDPRFYARPLPLLEALDRSGDRARRLWVTQAYWKVSSAFAAVRWATEAIERLELIAPGGDPHDRATLDVATAAARADLADARSQLGAAQQELVDLARLPVTDPLPWPVDRPLAIPYQTHFEAIFATRPATGRVRAIARSLPARHEALEARAAAVRAAEKAVAMAEADHAQAKRPIEAVIQAHAALVGQQREFLQATKAYNLDIAEYAMAAADLTVPDERFAAMLIGAPIQWRQPAAAPAASPPVATAPGSAPPTP
jgi:hypothetical protein